jgi:Macrocin-O-methyltransferase (TylF)
VALRADPPQRYWGNYKRYLANGGTLPLEEVLRGFLAGGTNQADMARFYCFCLIFDQIVKEGLTGDLAELGVYKGHTATVLAAFARQLGATAYLLDTYEGFSCRDLTGIDSDAEPRSFSDTSLEAVRDLVGEDGVRFVKGFFPDTAPLLPAQGTYCLVHIDCDLYAPITRALEYFYPRLVPGGFLIVHDYSSLHWKGAEKAVDEFFANRPECVIPLPDGAGSIAIRKARPPGQDGSWLDRKRRALLREDWRLAANNQLAALLDVGWSGPEPWGVWGVGDAHTLRVVPPLGSSGSFTLEADVHAVLTEARPVQEVVVEVVNRRVATWTFTEAKNRDIRSLRIPEEVASQPQVEVVFRPRSVARVSDIQSGSMDNRMLGLGLHRIRLRRDCQITD